MGKGIDAAFILAGGKGERLMPLTLEVPKPLVKVQGKAILEHQFDYCRKNGIEKVFLSIGHMKEKIKDFCAEGKNFGLEIECVEEREPLGTAGPLKLVQESLPKTFLMLNADDLTDINLEEFYSFHKKNKGIASDALFEVEDVSRFGAARMKGNRIAEFVEKPSKEEAPSNLVSCGWYLMEKEIVKYVSEGYCMLEKHVFPKIAGEGKLFGYRHKGQWCTTGTIEQVCFAEKNFKPLCKK